MSDFLTPTAWPSKPARDAAWRLIMADPRVEMCKNPMPFDGKRMIHGGFETLLDTRPVPAVRPLSSSQGARSDAIAGAWDASAP